MSTRSLIGDVIRETTDENGEIFIPKLNHVALKFVTISAKGYYEYREYDDPWHYVYEKQPEGDGRIVLDIVDLWPESLPIGKIKERFPFTLWRDRRDRSLPLADAIVTECDLYQQVLAGALKGLHPTTLYLAREERQGDPEEEARRPA